MDLPRRHRGVRGADLPGGHLDSLADESPGRLEIDVPAAVPPEPRPGRLEALDEGMAVDGEAEARYARHARAGAGSRKAGRARWRVRGWPPDAPGATVAAHVAAIVANDDDSEIGDRIYTHSLTIAVRPETDGPRTP